MRFRRSRLATRVAVLLIAGVALAPGYGQIPTPAVIDRQSGEVSERIGSGVDEPDIRTVRSLTPEERRKRTQRRKLRRADELFEAGKYEEGAALLESLDIGGSPHATSALAFSYSQSNRPERAIRYFERVLTAPELPESIELLALRQLGRLYHGRGRDQTYEEDADRWYVQARSAMTTWIQKSPSPDPEAYLFLARIELELNDLAAGIASLETAVEVSKRQGTPVNDELSALLGRLKSVNED
ncbi:MAG: tetratricopeptide repeat protein [Gammaproteobacteria bacterium]|nr:tetratricopeptide repeat protein [Gammaproteobacteria bacterium]